MPKSPPALRPLPAPQQDFIGLSGTAHLATGGEPPLLVAHRAAFERFAADKARGFDGYWHHWEVAQDLRARIARWLDLEAAGIGLLGNASEAIMRVANAIPWQPGENAVVGALDYASGRYALAHLKARGVELRLVPGDGWTLSEDALLAACDAKTKLVYCSQVNALTGQHLEIARIGASLAGTGTVLINDASHAFGVVPVSGLDADFTVFCGYKFSLGIHDGVLAWNRARCPDFMPDGVGWAAAEPGNGPGDFRPKPDVRRVEYGNIGHLGAYLMSDSLAYLESFGFGAIAQHVRRLSGRLIAGFSEHGLDVMTPADPARRAANAAFKWADTDIFMQRAAQDGVLVWGDNGRIRASVHLFSDDSDVDRLLDGLPGYLR